MADSIETSKDGRDDLAKVVMQRFWRSKQYREQHIVHQGLSFDSLIRRAEHQFRREYTSDDAASMEEAFGFCPSRYYGLVQQKVLATVAWMNDLIVNNLDGVFTVSPSPNPELDPATIERIREGVRTSLFQRMQQAGLADPELLLTADGQPAQRIERYLREQAKELKQVEQAYIISEANQGAQRIQTQMRDITVEGGFRESYQLYTQDRCLFGMGVMKFPDFQRKPVLKHRSRGGGVRVVWETKPWFRHVRVQDFYPVSDQANTTTNTGNTEYTLVTKAELIGMAAQDHYYEAEITEIVEEFNYRGRNWVDGEVEDGEYWMLDDTIPLLIHEGFFSGDELAEHGITGIDTLDYVNARVEICGGRTIRCELLKMPAGFDRSYFCSPFQKLGSNLLDVHGMGAMLWDTEQRVNRFMHLFEHNADWAARPPIIGNSSVFSNPGDATDMRPGGQYEVEERFGANAVMPEPARAVNTVSAQYHLLMSQVGQLLRMADDECGVPAYAYSSANFGQGSLGEYSQRMTNALRTIKQAALNEDIFFTEPGFTGLFNYAMQENQDDITEGVDVQCMVRGMTGLLKQDATIQRMQQALPVVMNDQTGLVSEQAKEYAVRQFLEQAGFPVDALGMSNPLIDSALAIASSQPAPGFSPGSQQVPALDGRSAAAMGNVASPSGVSNAAIPAPSLGG